MDEKDILIEELKKQSEDKDQKINEQDKKIADLTKQMEDLSSQVDKSNTIINQLYTKLTSLQSDYTVLEKKYTSLEKDGKLDQIVKYSKITLGLIEDMKKMMTDQNPFSEGIKMIIQSAYSKLSSIGIEKIETSVGDSLDETIHEPISTIEDEEQRGKIVQVYEDGYKYGEYVIRPVKVIVAI